MRSIDTYMQFLTFRPRTNKAVSHLIGEFSRRTLPTETQELINGSIVRLSEATSTPFSVAWQGKHRNMIDAAEKKGCLSFYVQNRNRPPGYKLVTITPENQVLVPSLEESVFFQLVSRLDLETLHDIVALKVLSWHSYSILEKGEFPRLISNEQDARDYGIEERFLADVRKGLSRVNEHRTLWWIEWGASLLLFSVDREHNIIGVEDAGSAAGKIYKRLPLSLLR